MSDLYLSLPNALRPPRLWALPGATFSFLVAFVLLHEWWTVGLVADPAIIAQYPFGSEAALSEGGAHYASAALYARSALYGGSWFMAMGVGFVVAAVRSTGASTAAYGLLVLSLIALRLLAQ